MHRWIGAALAVAALGWVAALSAGPLLPTPLAGLLYAVGALLCHQIPERSFHLQSFQLPVCARCFGLYAGGAMGSVAAVLAIQARGVGDRFVASHGARSTSRAATRRNVWTLAAAMPTLLTVLAEHGAGIPVSNEVRALAAVPFAGAVAFVVVRALTQPAVAAR